MFRRTALALAVALFVAAPASAGDDAAKPVPPAKPADPPSGSSSRVTLKNKRAFEGVVRVEGAWERRDDSGEWKPCGKDDPGASVRLWYVAGSSGFMVFSAKQVDVVEIVGPLDAAGAKRLVEAAQANEKRAHDDRERLRKERAEKRAAEAVAAEKAVKDAVEAERAAAEAAQAQADAEILAKFPPSEWSAARRDAIGQRRIQLHVNPNDLEEEFLSRFDEWARAAASAKLAEEKAKKPVAPPVPAKK